ncbi:MAG TPA: 5-amino-6-(D-ribitylamino)uracil--L-tyrosine 4-hydroxyphenyl transferase CofH [Ramlibacter sp.]|nr:5-amino-6-(D-ribitylamino)uracil--L-tyrosine 4-hydroxyphenyl transferase CofH [Ramlibacter sp.]
MRASPLGSAGRTELAERLLSSPLPELLAQADRLCRQAHQDRVSYSRKVFIPLTRLCRDVCAYCTFAQAPSRLEAAYLSPQEVLRIARAGQLAGCKEALFTLGDKPELRYEAARSALEALGYQTTVEYLAAMCELVLRETGLLPHINAGVMSAQEIAALRAVSVSQGLMLESTSQRLCEKGGPHHGSPDKQPARRLATIAAAGELAVPFTTGILIGIGETRLERIESLLAIADLQAQHGHIQEVIVQNFRAKPGTRMADAPQPSQDDLLWTAAVARLVLGPDMNIQVPPNLSDDAYPALLQAGINDWGGISPVTPDHVNPEAPWPQIRALEAATAAQGKVLVERLAIYPRYCNDADRWLAPQLAARARRLVDTDGYARTDGWSPGMQRAASLQPCVPTKVAPAIVEALARASDGAAMREDQILALFSARGSAVEAVCEAADALRAATVGDVVRYVVNRNINYTNICQHRCQFCAFAKGSKDADLRGLPYDLSHEEVQRRVAEAWDRGATEVCMQGGIHPDYTGDTYLALCQAVKAAEPRMHIHAFSPLEITHGARTLGLSLHDFLARLQEAGLSTLPGTAAEILDDEVRAIICPDKLNTSEWLQVMEAAHEVGLRSTATMMFGHVERPVHWARHLLRIRALQARTGGFTEFVPLPYVHMEAPMHRKGLSRSGPTFREAVLVHAVARLVLHPVLANIQVSWVKMGPEGVRACLQAGANDLGGTLMNESISRAAGTQHGQELPPAEMEALIRSAGRAPRQRTTLYGEVAPERQAASRCAAPLAPVILTPPMRRSRAVAALQE